MPKIPTYETQGRPTAEVPSVKASFQVPVTNEVLSKAQNFLTDYYVREKEEEAKIKSLDYENKLLPKLYDAYDKHSKNPFPSEASSAFLKEGKETIQSIIDNELSNENNFVKKRFLEKGNASLSSINLATLKTSRLLMEAEKEKVINDWKAGFNTKVQTIPGYVESGLANQEAVDWVNTNISDPDPTVSVNKKKFQLDSIMKGMNTLLMEKDSRQDPDFLNKLQKDPNLYPGVDLDTRAKLISSAEGIQEKRMEEYGKQNGKAIIAEAKFGDGADITSLLIPTINAKFANPKVREKVIDAVQKEQIEKSKTFKEKGAAEYYLNTFPNLRQEYALGLQDKNQMFLYKQSMDKIYSDKEVPEQYRTYIPYEKVREIGDMLKGTQNADEKLKLIQKLNNIYGADMMPSLSKQLIRDGLPTDLQIVMSTNSDTLKKDILSAASTKDLEEQAKLKLSSSEINLMKKDIYNKTKDFQNVILEQKSGAANKTELLLSLEKTLYNAALNKIVNGKISSSKAVQEVTDAFKNDYDLTPRTYFIPKDIAGVPVNNQAVKDKADTLLLLVEKSDYLDRFHGNDGFAHYATLAGYQNVLPENIKLSDENTFNTYVKNSMINSMKKNSKWLLNKDSTGIILHVDLANGTIPIVNAKGEKIEFYFTDFPNRNPKIKSIDSIEPGTGSPLVTLQPELYQVSP
jgi:hypothetical protein